MNRIGLVICLVWVACGIGLSGASKLPAAEPSPPPLTFLLEWGAHGTGEGEFDSPIGIAVSDKREVYVTEAKGNRVQKFSTEGTFALQFAVPDMPGGIAVDRDGAIYVASMMGHQIHVFDPRGMKLRTFGRQGTGDGEFEQPGGIAIAPDQTLYVCDQVNRRVQHFSREGSYLGKWGEYGTGIGQFDGIDNIRNRTGGPNFVAVDRHGHVFTTEARPGRIQKFSPEGKPLAHFGSNSTEPGGFGGRPRNLPGPIGICVDRYDRLWITATNNRVQCFTSDGKYLMGQESLTAGIEPGQFHTPHGIAFDAAGHLYVVDSQNQRVQKFAVREP